VEQFCDVCVLTKQRWLPFPQQSSFRAKEMLELVHGDLCGPVIPATLGGATLGGRPYFLLLIDDLSRYMWVMVLGSKERLRTPSGVCGSSRRRKATASCVFCAPTAAEFGSYYADEGVQCHFSASYSPQQNGVVERRNQTVVGIARALLKQRGMSAVF
jgi:transposase InsO family protein